MKTLHVGSSLYELASKALQFGKRALTWETFSRGDHKKLCKLFVSYLGVVLGFHFLKPGACHEARYCNCCLNKGFFKMLLIKDTQAKYPFFKFMTYALYTLTLRMTQNITKVINEEEKIMLGTRLSSSPSAMLHGFLSLTWLPKSPQMTWLPSSLSYVMILKL